MTYLDASTGLKGLSKRPPTDGERLLPKPKCGSKDVGGDYDVTLHVIGLVVVLTVSILGAGFPVVAKKVKWLRIPPRVFFFCKHFGTGVLIATAFVHLLPTAFDSLTDSCLPDLFTDKYPALPGVIGMGALFTLFAIEMWMQSKIPNTHSHGGVTGEEFSGQPPPRHPPCTGLQELPASTETVLTDDEKDAIMPLASYGGPTEVPLWFVDFYEQYMAQREQMMRAVAKVTPRVRQYRKKNCHEDCPTLEEAEARESRELGVTCLEHGVIDPNVYRKMAMEITLLEGGILFHSIFVGMTVSLTTNGFVVLLVAILFHQTFEGLGLGARIASVPYPKGSVKPWLLVFAFGTTAPIGQAIGLITHNTYNPNSAFALILVGTFNAISSGLLIYAALIDLLHQDFFSEESNRLLTQKKKTLAFAYVLFGAACMAIVGAFA